MIFFVFLEHDIPGEKNVQCHDYDSLSVLSLAMTLKWIHISSI